MNGASPLLLSLEELRDLEDVLDLGLPAMGVERDAADAVF
jgi:hypothetical protein